MGGHGSGVAAQLKYRRSQLAKPKGRWRPPGPIQREKWIDPKQPTFEELMAIRTRIRKQRRNRLLKRLEFTIIALILSFFILNYWIG